jgi:uncharacterized membrane protein YbaN (DUF454 family)
MTVNGPAKLFYIVLGIIFLVLGVVGLIIPILPGVLFLAGALYMLSRGSARVKTMADGNPTLRRMQSRMDQFEAVSAIEKAQVSALMVVQSIVVGGRKIASGAGRLFS